MSIIKSLLATSIIGAPTSSTLYSLEPITKVEDKKKEIKDGIDEVKEKVKKTKDDTINELKANKTTDITENIRFNNKKINTVIETSIITGSTTTTSTVANACNEANARKIENKNLTTYVEAMSEEELINALENLNLLDGEDITESNSKTI